MVVTNMGVPRAGAFTVLDDGGGRQGMPAPAGILVNAAAPGRFDTARVRDMGRLRAARAGLAPGAFRQGVGATLPAGRDGRPDEFARVVAVLASSANACIVGQTLLVDGGRVRAL